MFSTSPSKRQTLKKLLRLQTPGANNWGIISIIHLWITATTNKTNLSSLKLSITLVLNKYKFSFRSLITHHFFAKYCINLYNCVYIVHEYCVLFLHSRDISLNIQTNELFICYARVVYSTGSMSAMVKLTSEYRYL